MLNLVPRTFSHPDPKPKGKGPGDEAPRRDSMLRQNTSARARFKHRRLELKALVLPSKHRTKRFRTTKDWIQNLSYSPLNFLHDTSFKCMTSSKSCFRQDFVVTTAATSRGNIIQDGGAQGEKICDSTFN